MARHALNNNVYAAKDKTNKAKCREVTIEDFQVIKRTLLESQNHLKHYIVPLVAYSSVLDRDHGTVYVKNTSGGLVSMMDQSAYRKIMGL